MAFARGPRCLMPYSSFTRRETMAAAAGALAALGLHGPRARAEDDEGKTGPAFVPLPPAAPRATGRLPVVTTTPLLADLAWQIGGARVSVESLTPPNSDLHAIELGDDAVDRLRAAATVIRHGLKLDRWASKPIKDAGKRAVDASVGVATLPTTDEPDSDPDPHIWFDPRNVKVMAVNVANALGDADPEGADSFLARLNGYQAQLDLLDGWVLERMTGIPAERRLLITTHAAFAYFTRRYGLTFVGSAIPSADSRANVTRRGTVALLEAIATAGATVIFAEPAVDEAIPTAVADRAGIALAGPLYGDNLGPPASGAERYLDMMVWNADLIARSLAGGDG